LAAAKAALERLEAGRRVFLKGRALALAQRAALYARDELAMSALRIRVRLRARTIKTAVQGSPAHGRYLLQEDHKGLCAVRVHACAAQ
jgi:hypothetical protein